ncbi:MAG TPA: LacI family DNA-binding transcriptional regulator, partial [Trebonia sp.]|nr:LacI family DNA-binding transcriptional regulator [Trebonia sp.]
MDVARLAGVSPGTVSKALNGRGSISPETVRRV